MTTTTARKTARIDNRLAASSTSLVGNPAGPCDPPLASGVASPGWLIMCVRSYASPPHRAHKHVQCLFILQMAGFLRSVVFCSATAFAVPTFAQPPDEPQTRAELLRREREEKQRAAEPYKPTGLERAMDLGEHRIVPLLQRD